MTVSDIVRDAPFGQVFRWLTKDKFFTYPEEREGFQLPEAWIAALKASGANSKVPPLEKFESGTGPGQLAADISLEHHIAHPSENVEKREDDIERLDAVETVSLTEDGHFITSWYAPEDIDNPHNWSAGVKNWVSLVICVYTFIVYAGSSIYVSSEPGLTEEFSVGPVTVSLGLALYVLAYGIGPMIFAPLSEVPAVGRSHVYIITFLLFTVFSIPAGFVHTFAGLMILRFLQAFFGSPCLANGGASLQDMYSPLQVPYAMLAWTATAFCGPGIGPLLSGFAVTSLGWRWSLYEIAIACGPCLFLMFFFLPETSTANILHRRAHRLRKLTGDDRILSQSEIDQKKMTASQVLWDALIKPMEITIKDPAIGFVNLYSAIIYGVYYSFFESFPLVYPVYYGFSLGITGVVFTCIIIAVSIGVVVYYCYLHFIFFPGIFKYGMRAQEHILRPALFAVFGPPISLFIFAWTARADITWVAPTIGISLYVATAFIVFQCIFTYIPMSYPQYAASLFAANDFFRSSLGCGSVMFSRSMFRKLGVDKGVTLLAGLSVLGVLGMFGLWKFGANLRARSKFAVK